MSKFKSIDIFYKLLINLSSTSGLIMWLFILISYLQFRRALAFNSIVYETLAYTAVHKFPMIKLSYITIVSIVTIIIGTV